MSSKKRKVNSKSSKAEAVLNDHRTGDSDIGFSNGLRCGPGIERDKSPSTSYSGGDNGSASISSAFSPKMADSASASPLSVNSLSNQGNRVPNRIGDSEGNLPHKTGRVDLHQPYAEHFGSPTPQKYPSSSVPSISSQHGSEYFHAQFQQRVGHSFPPGFHHPPHLSPPNAYPNNPFPTHPYSQHQQNFHQPMNQQPLRPRPQGQPPLPSSYASSTPMLTQLLQYPTTKEKPQESGAPGGDYANSVKHFFGKKPSQWPHGPPDMANQNHLMGRMPVPNHTFRHDLPMSQSMPFNNQFFQPLDSSQHQTINHSGGLPQQPPMSSTFNSHPPPTHSKSPDAVLSGAQDGDQHAKASHKKKSGAKKSVKSRSSRMKRRPDVTRPGGYSSGEEKKDDDDDDGSDSSSSTEVYSQITPSSTPPCSPQPVQANIDQNSTDDLCEGQDKPHMTGYPGGPDMSRFQPGTNNGGFSSPGPMMRQPTPYPGQSPFPGQSMRHPHIGNFYSPYQTSSMAPSSKPTDSDAYGVFKQGPPYHHQQGTMGGGHHGAIGGGNFNAFQRPGTNGPSMPYPGTPEAPHQSSAQMPASATPYYRPSSFQGKPEPPYGARPEFFQSMPNHPGFPASYPYDMAGFRPELGYRHPSEIYRQEGPYQNFPGYRPDGPHFPGYRMHGQEVRMYRHPEHLQGQRHHEMPLASPGEFKPNESSAPGGPGALQRGVPAPDKNTPQQGNTCPPVDGPPLKQSEEASDPVRPALDSSAHSQVNPGKGSFPGARMNNQWVTNMQGMMSGGSVVETPQGEHGQPVVSMSSVKQMIGEAYDGQNKDLPPQHEGFSKNQTPAPPEVSDSGKLSFQHPQHAVRPPLNSELYHGHYKESPESRLSVQDNNFHRPTPSDGRPDTDSKSRNSRPSSRMEYGKHKPSSKGDFIKQSQDVYSPSMTPSNHVSMSPASQNEFDAFGPAPNPHQKFSSNPAFQKICEMGHEPDRPAFLERLFSFMQHRGSPITAVPMICKQTIDLYSLYFLVQERGGMIEVTKNKKWRDVSSALSLGSSSSAGFTLKRNYGKYIYPYECKFDRGDIDPAPFLSTLEIAGGKKEVVKKGASDRVQAASDVDNNSASNSYHDDKDSAYFGRGTASPGSYGGEYGEDSLSQHPPPYLGRPLQSPEYSSRPFHNSERFDMMSPHHEGAMEGPHPRFPAPPPTYRPYRHVAEQYPPHFDQRRMPDGSGDVYPPHHTGFWSPPHPPPHPFPQPPSYPFFGGPPGHFGQGPFPPRFNIRADMERIQRFPSMGCTSVVRMFSFPHGSVESLRAKPSKRRRLCHRDTGLVDPWRLLMSLKSGLLCETTWALDVLLILTRDDQTFTSISLSNMPGMLETLVEHFKHSLVNLFPWTKEQFEDLEISSEVQNRHRKQYRESGIDDMDDGDGLSAGRCSFHLKSSEIADIAELAAQKCKRKQAGVKYVNKSTCQEVLEEYAIKEWDCYKQLESSSFDWQMGRSDTTMHIVSAIADVAEARSDKEMEVSRRKFFGKEGLALLDSVQTLNANKSLHASDIKDLSMGIEDEVSADEVRVKEEADTEPICEKSSDKEVVDCKNDVKMEVDSGDDGAKQLSDQSNQKQKARNAEEELKNVDMMQTSSNKSSLYNRNESLIKEMIEINSFGLDGGVSTTFSCSQIEAVVASCLGDRTVIPTEAKHDMEYKSIKRKRESSLVAWDEEILLPDEGPLCPAGESRRELTARCLCVSTILRNLSFVPYNDAEMSKHFGLILVLGKLLRLKHQHGLRELSGKAGEKRSDSAGCVEEGKKEDPIPALEKFTNDEVCCGEDSKNGQVPNLEMPDDLEVWKDDKEADGQDQEEIHEAWWWSAVDALRENALVVFANVSGQLDLSLFPEEICIPVLDGLLHWMVCQVGNQDDEEAASPYSYHPQYHPSAAQHSPPSFRRLVLEALCKLCVLDSNVDLLLAVPPFGRILLLFTRLVGLFEERQPLVVREMAIGLLSRLVPSDPVVPRALALHRSFLPSVIDFLEATVDGRITVESHGHHHHHHQHHQFSPFHPSASSGTSVDVLCRVATILRYLAEVPENEPLVTRHQQRLFYLATLPGLNSTVASVLSTVLATCS